MDLYLSPPLVIGNRCLPSGRKEFRWVDNWIVNFNEIVACNIVSKRMAARPTVEGCNS